MRLREFFWHGFVIDTAWSPAVVATEINKRVAGPNAPVGDAQFTGRRTGERSFLISSGSWRNNVMPTIDVRVEALGERGARVVVRMRPTFHLFAWTFAALLVVATSVIRAYRSVPWPIGDVYFFVLTTTPLISATANHRYFVRQSRRDEAALRDILAAAPWLPDVPESGLPYR
ncbi:MAG TPA: hypothetical protein VHV30_05770 [Polyangiaceae bacterium]|jgi:hypothetical protein|nr:hypothetical protein [Polyangiaceae bacterium]